MTYLKPRSNSTMQFNTKSYYKYDKFGFIIVNNLEDLLYDKFNNAMENNFENNKVNNRHHNNKNKRMTYINTNFFKFNKDNINHHYKNNKISNILKNPTTKENTKVNIKKYKFLLPEKKIKSIPKTKKSFFTKSYSKEKDKQINLNKRILAIPKLSKCLFERKNKLIIKINSFRPLFTVKNKLFFSSKQIIIPNKKTKAKISSNIKKKNPKLKLSNKLKNNKEIPNILIKILRAKISSIEYHKPGKINIKAKWNTIDEKELNNKDKPKDSKNFQNISQSKIKQEIQYNSTSKNNIILNKNIKIKDKDIKIRNLSTKNRTRRNNIKSFDYKRDEFPRNNSFYTLYQTSRKNYRITKKTKGYLYIKDNHFFFPAIESYFNY